MVRIVKHFAVFFQHMFEGALFIANARPKRWNPISGRVSRRLVDAGASVIEEPTPPFCDF